MKKKIKVILSQDGSISDLQIPLRLRKDSHLKVDLLCYIPKEIETSDSTIVKVYATGTTETGEKVWTSQTYNLPYIKDEAVKNRSFKVFGNAFPKEFCEVDSDIYLTIACVDATERGDVVLLQTTATLNLTIHGDGYNDNDIVLGSNEKIASQLNRLVSQAVLKVNLDEDIPENVVYNVDGYKTPFHQFYPVEIVVNEEQKSCSVMSKDIVPDAADSLVVGYQTEFAFAESGVYSRTNKYNISQTSIGNYELLELGEWGLINQELAEAANNSALENKQAINTLSDKVDENHEIVTTKIEENMNAVNNKIEEEVQNLTSAHNSEISSLDNSIKNVSEKHITDFNSLSSKITTDVASVKDTLLAEIAKVNKKVDTGTNYIGQYPTGVNIPTSTQLTQFVISKTNRSAQRGDEVSFVLQVKNGVDKIYNFKYSEAAQDWDMIEVPGAELSDNSNAGYIIGTSRPENEQKLINGLVKMLIDIQSGEVKDISVYNKNICQIVSLVASAVLYDEDGKVLVSDLYGKDSDGEFSYIKQNGNNIEIGDHARITLLKGKEKKIYYSWIEEGEIKSDSFAFDSEVGNLSKLNGQTIVDYCVSLFQNVTTHKNNSDIKFQEIDSSISSLNTSVSKITSNIESLSEETKRLDDAITEETNRAENALSIEISRLNAAIIEEQTRATNDLASEVTRLGGLITDETTRATNAEDQLSQLKLDKSNINEDYLREIVFSLNGDTGVATATIKNPVTGKTSEVELKVFDAATSYSTGLMTSDMVKALNTAVSDIESLRYIGRQIQVFNTYADAELFDWSGVELNLNDYFVVIADESRELSDEKGKTTKYTCTSLDSPIQTETSFTYSGLISTVVIQVATETEVGGVLSVNSNGYVYVEPTGVMKLVGYDNIITSINTLMSNLSDEINRAKQAEEANATAISTESARAQSEELRLETNKANRTELPTQTSVLENDGDGSSPYATQAELPTKVSELSNDANYAKISQLATKLSQLQDDIGVSGKAESSTVTALSDRVEQIAEKNTEQDTQILQSLTDAKKYTDEVASAKAKQTDLDETNSNVSILSTQVTNLETLKADKSELFSKNYNDLTNKPTIPSVEGLASELYVNTQISNLIDSAPDTLNTLNELAEAIIENDDLIEALNNAIAKKANSADLSTVATSGSYNDLSNKPTINNATLTIQKNGTNIGTFTSNASSNSNVNITVPTGAAADKGVVTTVDTSSNLPTSNAVKTFVEGKGYVTSSGSVASATNATKLNNQAASYYLDYNNFTNKPTIPTNNNQLTNGAGYLTASDLLTKIYPVGSIYISFKNTSPASFLGGTWSQLASGYTLWSASSGADSFISAGLPNITGSAQITEPANGYIQSYSGAVIGKARADWTWGTQGAWSQGGYTGFDFDASKSNSIYGASSTVQPPAYKVYIWKRTA